MRTFKVKFSSPRQCSCCGAALAALPTRIVRGDVELSLPEGPDSMEVRLGHGIRVVLGGGKLIVELESTGAGRAWDLQPLYNDEAFGHPKRFRFGDCYSYVFELPRFNPWYKTWWAELKFVEIDPFKRAGDGSFRRADHAATMSVKLETLQ